MYKIVLSGNSREVGGCYLSGQKIEIPGKEGGLCEIPSVVGVRIFSGTTHCMVQLILIKVLPLMACGLH